MGRPAFPATEKAAPAANAEDAFWAEKYNYTKARGSWGHTDIAIRMNRLSDYTIKGMAFDPSDVAQMAARVGSQAVILAAQISGVPVTSAQTSGDGSALSRASSELSQLEEAQAARDSKQIDQQSALLDLASVIVRERGAIASADEQKRKDAVKAIKQSFDAHLSRVTGTGT